MVVDLTNPLRLLGDLLDRGSTLFPLSSHSIFLSFFPFDELQTDQEESVNSASSAA